MFSTIGVPRSTLAQVAMTMKLRVFATMNTASTAAPKASGSSLADVGSDATTVINAAPTTANSAYVPRLTPTGSHPRQSSAASTTTDASAMATAGAGPSN